jgi:hypothetical protein
MGEGGGSMMAAVPNHAPIRNANPNAIGGFSKTPLIFTHFWKLDLQQKQT